MMAARKTRTSYAAMVGCLWTLVSAPQAAAAQWTAIELTMADALRRGETCEEVSPIEQLQVDLTDRGWGIVCAVSPTTFNKGRHYGYVIDGSVSEDAVTLSLSLSVQGDGWVLGGRAFYDLTLTRKADGTLAGSYSGTYHGTNGNHMHCPMAVSGDATGRIATYESPVRSAVAAAVRGEHPRLLFRSADLPLLKAKARTPFGKGCVEMLKQRVADPEDRALSAAAFLYQLTGDVSYAVAAKESAIEEMADMSGGVDEHGKIAWGMRLESIATAYDLCYDAWTAGFKDEVARYLYNTSEAIIQMRGEWRGSEFSLRMIPYGINWFSGICTAMMALVGEESDGSAGATFELSVGDGKISPTLPAQAIEVGSMPVTTLTYGTMDESAQIRDTDMPTFVFIGGLSVGEGEDPFEAAGGVRRLEVQPGETLDYKGETYTWQRLSDEHWFSYKGDAWLDVTALCNREFNTTAYLYAVLETDEPRWVEYRTGSGGQELLKHSVAYIDGIERYPGDYAYLEAGRHRLVIAVGVGTFQSWAKIFGLPRLPNPSDSRRESNIEYYQLDKAEHEKQLAYDSALNSPTRPDAFSPRNAGRLPVIGGRCSA